MIDFYLKRYLFFISFIMISTLASGTKYYVSNTGRDSNSGLSDALAWAHHPWMSNWTGKTELAPGDTVLMKRGDTWIISSVSSPFITVQQNGREQNYIVTSSYGSSVNKPLIQISGNFPYPVIQGIGKSFIVFDDIEIKHHSSERNTSYTQYGIVFGVDGSGNISHDWIIANCEIHQIPHTGIAGTTNSYNITIGNNSAITCATTNAYSNQIYNCGYAGIGLVGRNPVTKKSNWVVSYNYIHHIDFNKGISRDSYGVYFSSAPSSDGWPSNSIAKLNRIENIDGWEGIDCHGGDHIFIQDNYIYNCHIGISAQAALRSDRDAPILDNLYIERNTIENPVPGQGKDYFFIQVAGNESYKVSNSFIRNNNLFFTSEPLNCFSYGIKLSLADGTVIEGNKIFNGPITGSQGGIQILGDNIRIGKNWIFNWINGIYIATENIGGSLTIYNNIILNKNREGCPLYASTGTLRTNLKIFNNVILASPGTVSPYTIDLSRIVLSVNSSFHLKNNIIGFITPSLSGRYIRTPYKNSGSFFIDNNLYWNSNKVDPFDYENTPQTWSSWNLRGYDLNGLNNLDPKFINASGSFTIESDFDIINSSPAINKGVDIGLLSDYAGNPISGVPDIGAFEYQSAQPAVPVLTSSVVENSTPSSLDLTFDLSLANIVPAASAFTVLVNSTARTVNTVAVSGTRVTLTLSSPVAYGNTVTVAYTRPSTNPLQTSAGGYVASFSARQVTNRVAQPAPAAPVYVSSVIENATPARLEISFDLTLANIVPAASAFTVMVNSTARTVSSVAVSGTRVTLTLSSPVAYGNTVTVAYTRPSANPLQTTSGGQAGSFGPQSVTNRVAAINNAPVVVVNYQKSIYSGFVYTLNATGSYDKDKDNLSYSWTNPSGVPVSASTGPIIKFLGPAVTSRTNMEFIVNVSDGKTTQAKSIPIEIVPYKPDLEVAEIINIEASSHYSQNYPYNVIDGSIGTMWSANGIDEWLIVELKEPFNVQNVTLAFMPGQKTESFFDVYGSDDKESWDPILMKSSSCGFSGDIQAFEFPASKAMKEYKYLKISGQGNSSDSWNYISEIKILGFRHPDPLTYENLPVKLYPNPVSEFVNVRIDEPSIAFNFIKIINLTGKIIYHDEISPEVREFQVPVNFKNGLYILQMGSDNITHFSSKLIVSSR
jgi:uncharacterized repeat protein (TIGR02059 family)